MSDCKPVNKSATEGVDLTSISSILGIIQNLFNMMQKPANIIPPALLLAGSKLRSGMSNSGLAAEIKVELDRAGIPTAEGYFADGANGIAALQEISSEKIVTMLQTKASVQSAIGPGQLVIPTDKGPVTNVNIVSMGGVLS